MPKISKAFAISNAKISFVSLVDKAANLKTFLITKAEDGMAHFQTFTKILEKNAESHYLTGIVYEPLTEDAHGNYMTAEEIKKAADWYEANGKNVDIQHSFKPTDGAKVVKSWIAKAGEVVGGVEIKEGTWLIKMEITDDTIWKAIEDGDITGFSMGGVGEFSDVDEDITKAKGFFKSLANFFGLSVVEKGEVAERYNVNSLRDQFWNAVYSFVDVVFPYNQFSGKTEVITDEKILEEAFSDLNTILSTLFAEKAITKVLAPNEPLCKAGKKLSADRRAKLQTIYDNLGKLLADTADPEGEENEMTAQEIEKIFDEKLEKALGGINDSISKLTKALGGDNGGEGTPAANTGEGDNGGEGTPTEPTGGDVSAEAIEKMMDDKLSAFSAQIDEKLSKATGVSLNLNNEPLNKSEGGQCFMHGFL